MQIEKFNLKNIHVKISTTRSTYYHNSIKEEKNKKNRFNLLFMNPRFFVYASVVTITWDSQKTLLQHKNTIILFGYSTRWMYKVTFSSL